MNNFIDLTILPQIAQRELQDFYEFLKQKYSCSTEKKVDKTSLIHRLLEKPIKVKDFRPFERNEIYENR